MEYIGSTLSNHHCLDLGSLTPESVFNEVLLDLRDRIQPPLFVKSTQDELFSLLRLLLIHTTVLLNYLSR